MHGYGRHAWLRGGTCVGYDEIRSMNRRYASYWNVFLLCFRLQKNNFPSCLLDCNPFTSATHTAGMNGFAPACSYFYSNIVDVQFIVAQSG